MADAQAAATGGKTSIVGWNARLGLAVNAGTVCVRRHRRRLRRPRRRCAGLQLDHTRLGDLPRVVGLGPAAADLLGVTDTLDRLLQLASSRCQRRGMRCRSFCSQGGVDAFLLRLRLGGAVGTGRLLDSGSEPFDVGLRLA